MITKTSFGSLLSDWRRIRRLSQLDLAIAIDASQRHLSFLESGRAQPSRSMIRRLADGLDLPLRARNALFLAAGFAAPFPERSLDWDELKSARDALRLLLHHHEPFPAIVTDAAWNIVMLNRASERILHHCLDADARQRLAAQGPINFMRLIFAPWGLQLRIVNFSEVRPMLLQRLRRELSANPASPSAQLWREIAAMTSPDPVESAEIPMAADPVVPLELRIDNRTLKLFTMLTSFGTPRDITLQELRLDMSFPADEDSRQYLAALADQDPDTVDGNGNSSAKG